MKMKMRVVTLLAMAMVLAKIVVAENGLAYVHVAVADGCEGMGTVASVDGNFKPNSKVTLKATAAKGYIFSGWSGVDLDVDYRAPLASFTVEEDGWYDVCATFAPVSEDRLFFSDFASVVSDRIGLTDEINAVLDVDSQSFADITVSGLPSGIKFNGKDYSFSGMATKTGFYTVTISGKNAGGYKFSQVSDLQVGGKQGEMTSASDCENWVGEDIEDYAPVSCGDDCTITFSGLPAGVTARGTLLSGRLTKAGNYVVSATVKYPYDAEGNPKQTKETVSFLWTVWPQLPGISGMVSGDIFYSLQVGRWVNEAIGYCASEDGTMIGLNDVKGLPAGLSLVKTTDENKTTMYWVRGIPTKAGKFTATFKESYRDDYNKVKTMSSAVTATVVPSESLCVSAGCVDVNGEWNENIGSVSGGGVYSPGEKVSLKAIPMKGYVFAGWMGEDGDEDYVADGIDYRAATRSFVLQRGSPKRWQAMFVAAAEDYSLDIGIDNGTLLDFYVPDVNESFYEFAVTSHSLPSLKVTGLPSGFDVRPADNYGSYALYYDSSKARTAPAPGVYTVTVKATNASKATKEAWFLIRVPNWTSEYINVPDHFGEFTPGAPITPIDLSQAVDFAGGASLKVSGLPKGLTWNTKPNQKDGAGAYSISGTPTVSGNYTVTFSATVPFFAYDANDNEIRVRLNEIATATLVILPYPELRIMVEDTAASAGCKVFGGGNYMNGSKVTLKATGGSGYVFAGWDGPESDDWIQLLNPEMTYVTTAEDREFTANFVSLREDSLEIYDSEVVFNLNEIVSPQHDNAACIRDSIYTVSFPTVSVSGLPAGLKFDAKTLLLTGQPTKPGIYYVTVSAKNLGGYSFTGLCRVVVLDRYGNQPEEEGDVNDAELDFYELDEMSGELYTGCEYRFYLSNDSIKSSSGLPPGMKLVKETPKALCSLDGYVLSGVPTKVGVYKMTFVVQRSGKEKLMSTKTIRVKDRGSRYLEVAVGSNLGTATGSGVYSIGTKVKLAAKPVNAKDVVFAGWWTADGEPFSPDGVDYRTASCSFILQQDFNYVEARFASYRDDSRPDIFFSEDQQWYLGELDNYQECHYYIDSVSLPKLTVKGLPKGFVHDVAGQRIYYSPTNIGKVSPGVYSVEFAVVNQSKAQAKRTLMIFVPNKTSELINADPDMYAYSGFVGTSFADALADISVNDHYTLSVSGLPSGITFKNGEFFGAPTKAGNYTVTLTAKVKKEYDCCGTTKSDSATITIMVEPLPSWLVGSFDGHVSLSTYDGRVWEGNATASITAAGKMSGKMTVGLPGQKAKAISFSSAAPTYMDYGEVYYESVEMNVPGIGKMTGRVSFAPVDYDGNGNLIGEANIEVSDNGGNEMYSRIYQSAWSVSPALDVPVFNGKPTVELAYADGYLPGGSQEFDVRDFGVTSVQFAFGGTKGAVTCKAMAGKTAVDTASAQLLVSYNGDERMYSAELYVYFAKLGATLCCDTIYLYEAPSGKIDESGISMVP